MKNLYHKLSLFSVLALVAFQNLQATSNNPGAEELQDFQKSQISPAFKRVQDTVQKINNGQFVNDCVLQEIKRNLKEIKQFGLTITPDHPLFDSWINLILKTFSWVPDFQNDLREAKERGESEQATPIAQYNLGHMYRHGIVVDKDQDMACQFHLKAGNRGYADSQYELSSLIKYGNENLEWVTKAADQGHTQAQSFLINVYQYGVFGDKDLAESLKWYLESYKDTDTEPNLACLLFIDFISSRITFEDERDHMQNQNILKNNILDLLGLHNIEKGVNNQDSLFNERKFAITAFFKPYQEIVDFDEMLLGLINGYSQSGFMVTCLQPKDKEVETFKSSRNKDIKYYEFQGHSFLTFGQKNIEVADNLMKVFNKTNSDTTAISNILNVLTEIQKCFQTGSQLSREAQALKKQYESRVRLELKNQPSNERKALTYHTKLVDKVDKAIKALTQLKIIPQQLGDLLIEGAPVRNKFFLDTNKHIKLAFEG